MRICTMLVMSILLVGCSVDVESEEESNDVPNQEEKVNILPSFGDNLPSWSIPYEKEAIDNIVSIAKAAKLHFEETGEVCPPVQSVPGYMPQAEDVYVPKTEPGYDFQIGNPRDDFGWKCLPWSTDLLHWQVMYIPGDITFGCSESLFTAFASAWYIPENPLDISTEYRWICGSLDVNGAVVLSDVGRKSY